MNGKCPHCATNYEFNASDLGKSVSCQVCGKTFILKDDSVGGTERRSVRRLPSSASRLSRVPLPDRLAKPTRTTAEKNPPARRDSRKLALILGAALGSLAFVAVISLVGYLCLGTAPRLSRGCAQYERGNYAKAYKTLLPLAQKGIAEAQVVIGDCQAEERSVFKNPEEAVKWYRLAAEQGSPKAQHRMFQCCRDGVGVERNAENAAKWCRKAAEAGLADAMNDMAWLYIKGAGVKTNLKSAFKWFRQGAECDNPLSLYQYGRCYLLGRGVEKDEDEAAKWMGKAVEVWRAMANAGDVAAMHRIGKLYEEGDVVDLDHEEAVKWFRRAAEKGYPGAQFDLALHYFSGDGIEKDAEEGAKWMLKAAEQSSDAMIHLCMGELYMSGNGVAQDAAEAVKWFTKATKGGSSMARYRLAMCYMNGAGVAADVAKGEALLEEAAEMGQRDAREELSKIHPEREEGARWLAMKKARVKAERTKKKKIGDLVRIEERIVEFQERINDVLKWKLDGDWATFDAGKITKTDSSVSVTEEKIKKNASSSLSVENTLTEIEEAISAANQELDRLHRRWEDIRRGKEL